MKALQGKRRRVSEVFDNEKLWMLEAHIERLPEGGPKVIELPVDLYVVALGGDPDVVDVLFDTRTDELVYKLKG